jgi:RimJ/RimL family protein N-acetyltransferase
MTVAPTRTRREQHRHDLAAVLACDVLLLNDSTCLRKDLGLDSLGMMSLITWLDSHGVSVTSQQIQSSRVGEVLSLLEKADFAELSIRLPNGEHLPPKAAQRPEPPEAGSLAPTLANQELRLTPVEPEDMRFLYVLASHPDTCYRWRYRGVPPSMDRFAADLWSQVLVQFVARRATDGEPAGHLVCYGADLGQGYAYLGAVFRPEYNGTGLAAQGVAMFVRYLFHTFNLRKLYAEVPGFNWPQMSSGNGTLLQVEGIMRNHEHYAGQLWDRYLCAIYPESLV